MAKGIRETGNAKALQGRETKARLIAKARDLFAAHGFSGTRFDSIGADLGKTARRHVSSLQRQAGVVPGGCPPMPFRNRRKGGRKRRGRKDPLDGILRGCKSFIAEVVSEEYFRIMLIDSVSVLGWADWKAIDSEFSERELALGLREAQDRGMIAADVPAAALARFLSGGTNELALWLHHEPNRESGKKQAEAALRHVVEALRADSQLRKSNLKPIKKRKP